ncbi:hypothetical protein K461DRAFT_218457 [Myriangium duriaei CBS 260.36]|uniref:TECPR1-like DysF domain-containing protein n=1 Tax=Myriangium duriaei CBS 260.36 TaxID=1168546 RepID=A0A9P4JCN8_9PEZI|nr:hypothetical protein K461DRAFT_218457 [Myriangium duriaei CBS 260.36]
MDTPEYSTFAVRDDAIPVLRVPFPDAQDADSDNEDGRHKKRDVIKSQAEKLKNKLEHVKDEARSGGLQERLLNSLVAQIIPSEDIGDDGNPVKDRRSRTYVERPNFSLPAMSSNFRRFNSRIGIVFVFQNRLIRLFSWTTPTHTLSFLAAYTFICLQPALIPAVPFALIFFFVMIPSFLARHPPPPYPSENTYAYTIHPTAPPRRVRPAPEMSKDFFRNMRDLQNSMEDFSRLHDAAIANITPYTDFSDEKLSSSVFLLIFSLLSVATVTAHLVPWRLLAVLAGWGATISGHPRAQEMIVEMQSSKTTKQAEAVSKSWLHDWINSDILLDDPPEVREVEVFELQRRHNPYDGDDENWEAWLFATSPHDPLCPQRLSGAWPAGTQFFEEVAPPQGWLWRDKKWTLDLLSEAWVEERCVTGVEVEREGGRWVYDIAYPEPENTISKKTDKKLEKQKNLKSWEEGSGKGQKGEWRRRRWVRLVERKAQKVSESE